jgi:hypothetical protein
MSELDPGRDERRKHIQGQVFRLQFSWQQQEQDIRLWYSIPIAATMFP